MGNTNTANKSESDFRRFEGYKPGEKNTVVVVISDACQKDKDIPLDNEQSTDKAEKFMKEIITFCDARAFEITSFGDQHKMIARFAHKGGRRYFTAEEMCAFTTRFMKLNASDGAFEEPNIDDVKAWDLKGKK